MILIQTKKFGFEVWVLIGVDVRTFFSREGAITAAMS